MIRPGPLTPADADELNRLISRVQSLLNMTATPPLHISKGSGGTQLHFIQPPDSSETTVTLSLIDDYSTGSVENVDYIELADGLALIDPLGDGDTRIDLLEASAEQRGIVSTGNQVFNGIKIFTHDGTGTDPGIYIREPITQNLVTIDYDAEYLQFAVEGGVSEVLLFSIGEETGFSGFQFGTTSSDYPEIQLSRSTGAFKVSGNTHTAKILTSAQSGIVTSSSGLNEISTTSTVDSSNDLLLMWDDSESEHRAVTVDDVLSGSGDDIPAGTIVMYGGTTAPSGWLLCDGTSYTTASKADLFAAIGYSFGGSGANFNVPDMQSRSPIGQGAGSGLSTYAIGATGGVESHSLTNSELSAHNHNVTHNADNLTNAVTALAGANYGVFNANAAISTVATGSGAAHETRHPYLAVNFIIKE